MSTLILRLTGVVLTLIGLVGAVIGGWFLTNIGTSGTATFTADPAQRVVVLAPDVLNRVDHPIEVTATGAGDLWAGTARPSDVEALLGDGSRVEVTGVEVADWSLVGADAGKGRTVDPAALDIWQQTATGSGEITHTIEQADAPQSLVISAPAGAEVDSVTMTVADSGWGTTALVVLIVGLLLLAAGLALLVRAGLVGAVRGRISRSTRQETSA